jgi:hypothetical protein
MNHKFFAFLATICCCFCTQLLAAPFQNLDFEQGSFQAPPANYTPSDPLAGPNPISAAAGLPFWTALEDSTVCTAIWGNEGGLNETSVALFNRALNPALPVLDGNYSVLLTAAANAPPDLFKTSSISQTGQVPRTAKSIQFLILVEDPTSTYAESNPLVTLNGATINLIPISTNSGVVTLAGDISAFAGIIAQLTITAAGTPGSSNFERENDFVLDDISFSPNPAPEPSTLALLAFGSFGLLARRLSSNRALNFVKT